MDPKRNEDSPEETHLLTGTHRHKSFMEDGEKEQ